MLFLIFGINRIFCKVLFMFFCFRDFKQVFFFVYNFVIGGRSQKKIELEIEKKIYIKISVRKL